MTYHGVEWYGTVRNGMPHPLEGSPVCTLLPEVLVPRVEVAVEVHQRHRSKFGAYGLDIINTIN